MKFHWGTGIFIFLGIFVLTLIFILYQSRQVDNSLVVDKYYEEDIHYQKKYEKIDNYVNLPRKVNFVYIPNEKKVQLIFPYVKNKTHVGKVILYRANAKDQDRNYKIELQQDSIMPISLVGLASGKWSIKLDWMWGDQALYTEQSIIIQ